MPLSLCPMLPFAVAFMLGIIFNGTVSSPLWVSVPLALCALFIILRRHYISILSLAIALGFMVSEAHRPLKPGFVSDGGSVSMSRSTGSTMGRGCWLSALTPAVFGPHRVSLSRLSFRL
ncbi:hypothetical protein [uncultured Duncaniella sp.]|uniref:hypothetical protein n=1 Tax=uncultured Duncaniella sp. TaxID=2768039 RepID=UPI002658E330|nr:hypothetical protein [uncultured Duncaniella sp.]